MDPLMVSLRILHIVFGVFWVGATFFMVLVLQPRLRALGPAIQNPVMGALMPAMFPFMIVSSVITIGSGVAITLIMRWGTLGMFLASGWGWAILLGFVTAIVAFIVGFGILIPTGRRQAALAGSIEGRPPSPEEAQQLGRLAARIKTLTLTNFVLLLVATGASAAARYV